MGAWTCEGGREERREDCIVLGICIAMEFGPGINMGIRERLYTKLQHI